MKLYFENRSIVLILLGCTFLLFSGCKKQPQQIIQVKNNYNISWVNKTVSVPFSSLDIEQETESQRYLMKDIESGKLLPVQWVDLDKNGEYDALIFQVSLEPHSQKKFQLTEPTNNNESLDTIAVYSRFVPERIDDYAWENDRVAFRMYGPQAQKLAFENNPDGIISSGIDCWFKRVHYPVIDKWYKEFTDKTGNYHVDSGEGLDAYSVGSSRGCGGIGIWKNDTLFVSKNFVDYKTLENGPIRTCFKLDYEPWMASSIKVNEKKLISLDLGSNLSRIEVVFEPPYPETVVAGLSISYLDSAKIDVDAGFFSCMDKIQDSETYYGIVAEPKYIADTLCLKGQIIDKQLSVFLHPVNGRLVYYTGFGWKKSRQFDSLSEWNNYLLHFSQRLASSLQVEVLD